MSLETLTDKKVLLIQYPTKGVGRLAFGVFGIASMLSYFAHTPVRVSLAFLALAIVGLAFVFLSPKYELSDQSIVQRSIDATFKINWDEITEIEFGKDGFIFRGGSKAFVMLPASSWRGPDVAAGLKMIKEQAEKRNIPKKEVNSLQGEHQNVRV